MAFSTRRARRSTVRSAASVSSGVGSVRQGKVFDVELDTSDKAKAEAELKAMCDKLLANTVIENYAVELDLR